MSSAYTTPSADDTPRNAASHWRESLPQQYAFRVSAKKLSGGDKACPLQWGDVVTSSRGEDWTFKGVSRPAQGNSSGRVAVSRPCPELYDAPRDGWLCPHTWHRDGLDRMEYFPSVFGLYLGDAEGKEA